MRNIFLRGISVLLAVTLIIGSAPVSVFATETVTDPTEAIIEQINTQAEGGTEVTDIEEEPIAEYEYITSEEGNAVITKYNGSDVFVTVPETIDDITVVGIGGNAFVNNADILEVIIPEGITSIESGAFSNCTELNSIVIPASVTTIALDAFTGSNNVKLLCYFNTPAYTYVQENAMRYIRIYEGNDIEVEGACTETLKWHLNLVTGLFVIHGTGAMPNYTSADDSKPWYSYKSKITSIKILDGVTSVGNYAFYNCTGLNGKITIEGNAESTTIGQYAFANCCNATALELGDGITSIGANAFDNCYGMKGNLVIPDTVKSIGNLAFYNCYGFDGTLKLSENLTSIPRYAFYNCNNITGELVIPDNVARIESYEVFSNCNKITSIVFGEGLTYVYDSAFYGCTAVKEITFKGLTVPNGYFMNYLNTSLETVYVPAKVYSNYVNAFKSYINPDIISCDSLKSNIKDFRAVGRYNNTIALSWSAHINENVVGYVVLRNGEKVATTTVCNYTDTNLEPGTYTYSVYGITTAEEVTSTTTLTTSTAVPELVKIYTNHIQNSIGPTDGKIFITATNNNNFNDLEGNEIKGKLYYVVDGERIFIGESVLSQGSTATSQLVYTVNWDVTDVEAGEYPVVFTIEDIDGASAEIEGTINVNKSVPEKIINVIAVGEFTKINLSWSQSSEVDSNTYKIYRKSEVDTKWFLVKTITNRTTLTYVDSNVKEGRKYYYYVVTENSFGTQSEPSEVAVAMRATDIEAPTVTKFTPSTNSFISKTQTITVTAVDNLVATSAKLYYSLDDGETWTLIGEDASAPFNFTFNTKEFDDGVITMQAFAYDAEGNESLPMTCKYSIDNTGPEKVTGLAAKAILTSKLTLEWNDVSDSDAACFILQQKTANGYTTVASTITTLGYNLSNLVPSTEYTYRVAAVDVHGNIGKYSDEFTVSTAVDTIPPVVTSLAPSPSRHNNSILFKATAGDDCGIQSIAIQVSTDRVEWETVSVANYSTYSKTATYAYNISLADYTDCSIFVRAIATDFSNNQSDTTDAAAFVEYIVDKTAPTSPKDLIASGGDGWIYISWLQGAEEDLNTYSIFRSTSENSGYSLIASGLKKVSYYDTTAERDTVYYYKIRVTDTTGNTSDFSDVVSAKVADDITPPEVININPASGSFIGPAYKTVEALVKDNNCIKDIVVEYRINDETEFKTLKKFKDIGYYYTTVRTDLPIGELADGDKIYIRVYATDITGLTSEYSCEYTYVVDRVAPTISGLAVGIENDNCKITWSDVAGADISGYKVYRINDDGTFTFLGSRSYSSSHSYTFYDFVYNLGEGDYAYKIEAYDKVGNSNSFFTDPIHYKHERENVAPVAVINGFEVMEVGVEEFFDAGSSKDDSAIVSYLWDFGDGTTSTEIKTVKKYSKPGTYTVTLTVTDDDEVSTTEEIEVTVSERTAVGTVRVNVVDENGSAVSGAPVYYDLGNEKQKIVYTDSNGVASLLMEKGDHPIGVYKSGYLPVQKNVTVLPNATRVVTMTIIEQEIVTGKFEVTRMTFSEIKAAGIDVYSPANQNVYKVNVTLKYGGSEVPISYVRNDSKIISYEVKDSGGGGGSVSSGGGGSASSGGGGGKIGGITFIPNEKNAEIIAVLEMPVAASCLKEFFDVKLHIVNNASPEFKLVDNDVYLNVPEGMTMMQGLTGDWYETPAVHIDSIVGQETKTLAWVLRGDKEGEYNLQADFDGTLAVFNEPVHASFKTDEPIKVYGLDSYKLIIEANDEIKYNALYFNFGMENITDVDLYNPVLDFDGIVSNITASTRKLADGLENDNGETDFVVESNLLNVRIEYNDGTEQYIPYTWNADGTVTIDADTLSPGDAIYYEYVAYNVIDYDNIAYFKDASVEVLEGYSKNVEVRSVSMNMFSFLDSEMKLNDSYFGYIFEGSDTPLNNSSINYASNHTYYAKYESGANKKQITNGFLYDDSFFAESATNGINQGIAISSLNVSSVAYAGEKEIKKLLGKDNLGFSNLVSKNYDQTPTADYNDFVAYTFGKKEITVDEKTYNLVVVAVRGTTTDLAWLSNVNIGESGTDHLGFRLATNELYANLESYCAGLSASNTKFWITGHSRGAAVGNMLAEKLTKEQKYAKSENIYAYTFATPLTSTTADTSLKNIINYCNNDDFVTMIPLEQWGFKRAGVTVDFSLNSEARTAFNILEGEEYQGADIINDLVALLAKLVPSVSEYYSLGVNVLIEELAKGLGGEKKNKEVVDFYASIANAPYVKEIKDLAAYFKDFLLAYGFSIIAHAHCSEAYIAHLSSVYSQENVLASIKDRKGDVIKEFSVDRSNALSYILNDSNYMYMVNSSLLDKVGEYVYKELDLLLTLNFDVITEEQQKNVAKELILEIITDKHLYKNIDDIVDGQYVKAVKNVLSVLGNTVSTSDKQGFEQTLSVIDGMLDNTSTINSLAGTLKTEGSEGLQRELVMRLAGSTIVAANLQYLNSKIAECCDCCDSASALFKGLSGISKYGGIAIEYLVQNSIDAINSTEYAEYINTMINLYACREEALLILDTIIRSYSDHDKMIDIIGPLVAKSYGVVPLFLEGATDIQKIVVDSAKELKAEIGKNFDAETEMMNNYLKETLESGSKTLIKAGIKKLLGKANVWYALLGTAFGIVDNALGLEEKYKLMDTFNTAAYITNAMSIGFAQHLNAFISKDVATLNSAIGTNYGSDNDIALAINTMYLLKAIVNMRLTGENTFKKSISDDNATVFQGDSDYDAEAVKKGNKKFGTKFLTAKDLFDYIYENILMARDILFNIEYKTEVVKPEAPTVTINYDTLTTNEAFDSSYEYCLADGEWKSCNGFAIPIKTKTHTTILRVRKASGNGTVAGEITTVTINAQRELSKTISAKYDSGKYYFNNLLSVYDYQVCPLETANDYINWSNSFEVNGGTGASASGKQGKYLAIRTLANEELRETVSQTLVIPVATKQPLVIDTWGNGTVTQSSKSGTYFIGDNVTLNAKAAEGAIFRGWYIGNELVSKDSEYILEMYPYAEIIAKFEGGTSTEAESIGLTLMTEDETYDVQPISTMSLRRFATQSVNSVTVYTGSTAKLYAGVYPANATDKAVTWTSSDNSIATVDANGIINFLTEGTVIITATLSNGVSASFEIVVLANKVEDFYIATPVEKTKYYEDENLDLTGLKVLARYSDGNILEITNYAVSGYEATCGQKTITVSYEGKTVQFNVEVVHNTDWTVSKEATCSEEGTRTKYCIICGEVLETQLISKIAHKTVWKTTKEATPEAKGVKELVCTVCGTSTEQKEVDYCEHSFKKVTIEPDCKNKGYTEYTCTKCDEVKISDYVDALGHSYKEKVVAPSCGKTGYTIYTCSLCDDKYADSKTDALEHNYAEQTVEPTCSSHGCVLHTCSICGDSYETDIVKKVPHSYEMNVTEPACDAGGYTTYTCKTCGNAYEADETNPLGHSYKDTVISGNCEEGKYILHECTVCGYSYKTEDTAATDHTYGEWLVRTPADEGHAGVKYRTCIYCNHEETAAIPVTDHTHTAGEWYVKKEATCDEYGIKAQKCDQCGEIVNTEAIEPTVHNYTSVDTEVTCIQNGYTTHTCSKCGDTYQSDIVVALGHMESDWVTDVEVTCTTDGKRSKHCTVCNETTAEETVESTGHINCVWIVIEEATCTLIGSRESKCLACGEIVDEEIVKPLGHKYSTVTTEVSCTENGFTSYTCSVCSDHYDSDVVEANGHVEGEWEVVTEPTTTSEGLKVKYCTECDGLLKQETIPSLRIPVENIVLNKTTAEILCEQQLQLSATIAPDVATNKAVKWQSSNENVATVDSTGFVTAVLTGKATITATAEDNGISASCEVTVKSNMFRVAWVVDGTTTEQTVKFGDAIAKPDDPAAIGCKFVGWTPAVPETMPAYDLTFTAVFETLSTVQIKNNSGSNTIKYGETLRLTAITTDMPANAMIYWYVDGVKQDEGETFDVSFENGTKTVEVKLVDSNGNVLKDASGNEIKDSESVTVKGGFFQKIISFFKNLFRMNRTVVQSIFKGVL